MTKPKYKTMVKQEAKKRGIKLGWIADQINMEPTKFSRIANGFQLPNIIEALNIAKVLGVTVYELWPEEDDTERSDK